MALRAHPETPGITLHLVRRGRGGGGCFNDTRERLSYIEALTHNATRHGCAVHAYVLMGNHVHLLATPAREGAASALMRALAAHGTRKAAKSGAGARYRWEERYDASPVHARRYLFACMRYIEMNPVRARIVARPGDFRWSSYRANALGRADPVVTPHPLYYALGRSGDERQATYRLQFDAALRAPRGQRTAA